MEFIPNQPEKAAEVPFYEDATSEDGWQGQATEKTIERLKSDLTTAISRLGATVTGFQRGSFVEDGKKRDGYRIHYTIESPDGKLSPGRIDIAALPVRNDSRTARTYQNRCEKSLKMALYMLKISIDGLWFTQQLSPGFSGLMPFMLMDGNRTVSQVWMESRMMSNLLPPGEADFIEGQVKIIN